MKINTTLLLLVGGAIAFYVYQKQTAAANASIAAGGTNNTGNEWWNDITTLGQSVGNLFSSKTPANTDTGNTAPPGYTDPGEDGNGDAQNEGD